MVKEHDTDTVYTYHAPKGPQQKRYEEIRAMGKKLAECILHRTPSHTREQSIALTKLEEAVMWANACIARNEKYHIIGGDESDY